jgi:DNA-binding beta-propeller fold protein YncE
MSFERNGLGFALGAALTILACSKSDDVLSPAEASTPADAPTTQDATSEDATTEAATSSDATTEDASSAEDFSHLVIIGNDEKVSWDTTGKQLLGPPGADTVKLLDITQPLAPQITGSLSIENSVTGPPTNVAIIRQHGLALVANARKWVALDGGGWTSVPGTTVTVVDLAGTPSITDTIVVGQQPSGIGISPQGDLALVANRADGTLSVLAIQGKAVTNIGTATLGPPPVVPDGGPPPASLVSAVAFTPDGLRALVTRVPGNQVAIVDVSGTNVTYNGVDVEVGKDPYNIVVSADGRIALTADNGNNGAADGVPDTVSVIDLEANPPVRLAQIEVGDAPEGLAVSADGKFAAVGILNGTIVNQTLPYYHPFGIVVGLSIDGKTVTKANQVNVLGHPQGLVFTPDSKYLYAANMLDQNLSILQIVNGQLVDTSQVVPVGGHPASMR